MKFVLDLYQICTVDLALAKSGTNFIVRDKLKNPLNLTDEQWKSETKFMVQDKFVSDHGQC